MTNRNDINELLRRYDEALTTDAEERQLAEFFRSTDDIPDEWADHAALFKAFDEEKSLFSDEEKDELLMEPKEEKRRKTWLWAAAVAALVVVTGASLLRLSQLTKENAELIAHIEEKAAEIHQESTSDGSIFTQIITGKPNNSTSKQKTIAKVGKEVEEKGDGKKGVEEKGDEKKEIIEVSGSVFSTEDKEPVYGAIVVVVGTKIGTVTNVDGNFSLRCPKSSHLQVSYIGMFPTVVEAQPSLNIALAPDDSALDEIIVVGYGTSKKSEYTGSIRIRGTSAPTDDNGILVLINGEECSDFPFYLLKNGTDEDIKNELLKPKGLILDSISVWKADAVNEKYRKKYGDWVKAVIEIKAHPINSKEENQPDSLNS